MRRLLCFVLIVGFNFFIQVGLMYYSTGENMRGFSESNNLTH